MFFFYEKISLKRCKNIKEIEKILGLENYKILNILKYELREEILSINYKNQK